MEQEKKGKKRSKSADIGATKTTGPLREFWRHVSYGCYRQNDLEELLNKSPRTVEYDKKNTQRIIDPQWVAIRQEGKFQILRFRGDYMRYHFNYLATLFQNYAPPKIRISDSIAALACFSESGKEQKSIEELWQEVQDSPLRPYDRSKFSRNLNDGLCAAGILQVVTIDGCKNSESSQGKIYKLCPSFLCGLKENELQELLTAIDFYKHVFLLSFPGHMLQEKIESKLGQEEHQALFLFTHNNPVRILDEEIVYNLLQAMRKHCSVFFSENEDNVEKGSEENKDRFVPIRIISDYLYNRQQVEVIKLKKQPSTKDQKNTGWATTRQLQTKRVEEIPVVREPVDAPSMRLTILLRGTSTEKETTRQQLNAVFGDQLYIPKEGIASHVDASEDFVEIDARDPHSLIPLLFSFGPAISVSDESDVGRDIRKKLKQRIERIFEHSSQTDQVTDATSEQESGNAPNLRSRTFIEFYNEFNTPTFLRLCSLLNEVHSGEQNYTAEDLEAAFGESSRRNLAGDDQERFKELVNKYFIAPFFDCGGTVAVKENFTKSSEGKNPLIPEFHTAPEREFLRALADDKEYDFLLSEKLRQKLKKAFSDVQPLIPENTWERKRARGNSEKIANMQPTLQKLVSALQGNRYGKKYKIRITTKGLTEIVSPCRLMYDLAYNSYTLLYWDEAKNELRKRPLSEIDGLEKEKDFALEDTETKMEKFLEERRRSVTLQITPEGKTEDQKENIIKRCFALFSAYDKDGLRESEDKYHLTIRYYDFEDEKASIIKKILSLSYGVAVKPPSKASEDAPDTSEEIREEVLKQLRVMREYYKK